MELVLISMVGAFLTFKLAKLKSFGAIRSSALLTISYIGISVFLDVEILTQNHLLFFGATFVGMCSHRRFSSTEVIISSVIYCGIFEIVPTVYESMGGALGFTAFLSVLIVYLVKKLIFLVINSINKPTS